MKSLLRSLFAATLIALVAVGLVGCDDKEKKQLQQIEELTTEIKQIEAAKTSVEGTLDSLTRDRETMVAELTASKTSATDLTNKLRATNSAYASAKAQNVKLLNEVKAWRTKADSLAKQNEKLAAQVTDLTKRLEDAEGRAVAAETKLEVAEGKIREYEALLTKNYYVSSLDIKGFRGGEEQSADKIKSSAQELRVSVNVVKPNPKTGEVKLTVKVIQLDGKVFYQDVLAVPGTSATLSIDIKGKKLDLDKGRHTVEVLDAADGSLKLRSFFYVSATL
jgi:predicted  nucleic acid-binding Zn-ribbon protein